MGINLFFALILAGGWLAARLVSRIGMPGILGMLLFGIAFGAAAGDFIPGLAWEVEPFLKGMALIIILLRAGLGIKRRTLNRVGRTALLLAVVPCTLEALVLMPLLQLVFGMDWIVAGLTAWMLAAVSPAVVVPAMLELKAQGLGKRNDIPTMVLAGASVDDVLAITFFSVFLGLAGGASSAGSSAMTAANSALLQLAAVPLSVLGGILIGAAVGLTLAWWFRRHHERIRATEKAVLLLVAALLLVELGEVIAVAALLGVMTVGFVLLEKAEPVAHELAAKLAKLWVPAELILFVYIGIQLNPGAALQTGIAGIGVVAAGLAARSAGVILVTSMDRRLVWRERWFCAAAYLPKATVQAALGAVPLAAGIAGGETILSLAVIAILVTAPLGLVLIRWLGPELAKI
ncbi:cation:proton antiporter [Spirochaeta africana]|uniref:NhaP-type Na+(K+)/H+ antiporter n=1 Tax=Spirochaeta africana (strain ATCC 700263 / DSM 8902 / Z-7692) TaxID=889378 RepID=H9UHM1_SPIAZ|nr:cation:proton antiporter [Spirochaeta africana]AFG37014.1 NhaP-type Na+(K+)/H+ antiporter [Spirochaeta africana DSM 8902]